MRNIAWCVDVWKTEGGLEQAGHGVDNVGIAVLLLCNRHQPPELYEDRVSHLLIIQEGGCWKLQKERGVAQ